MMLLHIILENNVTNIFFFFLFSRKLFVGGLNPNTTEDSLKAYFATFGAIEECILKFDPETQNSKGFGFVTFADPKSVEKVRSCFLTRELLHVTVIGSVEILIMFAIKLLEK